MKKKNNFFTLLSFIIIPFILFLLFELIFYSSYLIAKNKFFENYNEAVERKASSYLNLEKNQKVTAQPTVSNNIVYFPIYEPNLTVNQCLSGKAILRDTKTDCGSGFRSPITLGTGILSKVQTFTNKDGGQKVIVSIGGSIKDETTTASGFTRKDNIIVGDAIGSSTCDADPDLCVTIEGWREN